MIVYEPARILPLASNRGWFRGWARVSIILRAVPEGKLGIAVQGDDETDIRQALRPAHVDKTAGAFRPGSVDQPVELLELSALSLPPDIFLLGFTPGPFPVKKEEAPSRIALIEAFQPGDGRLQQRFVLLPVG